jgi:hypothetical protein
MEGKNNPFFQKQGRAGLRPRDGPAWAAGPAGADVSPRRSKATDHEPIMIPTTNTTYRQKNMARESHRIPHRTPSYIMFLDMNCY